jgi:hypothetical protein
MANKSKQRVRAFMEENPGWSYQAARQHLQQRHAAEKAAREGERPRSSGGRKVVIDVDQKAEN